MQDKILDYLKRHPSNYVSGEDLSSHLKISRQALWKHIQEFKDSGYEIEAVPHLGYKLVSSPDRLFASEINRGLNTKFIGKKIYYFDSIGSTMDMAQELGIKQAAEGTVILSENQSKGRGRMGRQWLSPKYKGIYLSLILRPKISPNASAILTLLAAVSICEAIKKVAGMEAKIKWPNDIFIQQKKLGGILTELNAEADQIRFLVIGIGLNINNDKKSLVSGATSLKEEKGQVLNRVELLQEMLRVLERNYLSFQNKGAGPIADKWRSLSATLGKRIKVSLSGGHLEGEAVDIDSDGALLLRNDAGLISRVTSGDVTHCR